MLQNVAITVQQATLAPFLRECNFRFPITAIHRLKHCDSSAKLTQALIQASVKHARFEFLGFCGLTRIILESIGAFQ